jgi:hypothetical protein
MPDFFRLLQDEIDPGAGSSEAVLEARWFLRENIRAGRDGGVRPYLFGLVAAAVTVSRESVELLRDFA